VPPRPMLDDDRPPRPAPTSRARTLAHGNESTLEIGESRHHERRMLWLTVVIAILTGVNVYAVFSHDSSKASTNRRLRAS
jgi:hypothetical protein